METKSKSGTRLHLTGFCLTIVLIIISSCTKENITPNKIGGAAPGASGVWMQNKTFMPSILTVPANTTVTWTNKDYTLHTVTSDNDLFSSGNLTYGGTYSYVFTSPGTYPYLSVLDSGMTGTVIVISGIPQTTGKAK